MEAAIPAPLVSLALLGAYAALSVGWRARLQLRRTGDAGLRLRPASATEWSAGALLTLGLALSAAAPAADLVGLVPRLDALAAPALRVAGGVLAAAGIALTLRAQLDMGASWRLGVRADETAPLVTRGLFEHVRNPIFTAALLAFAGLALLVPNALSLAGWTLLLAGLELQVRRVEEPHLARVHGARYDAYAARAGRFLPRLGRVDPARWARVRGANGTERE